MYSPRGHGSSRRPVSSRIVQTHFLVPPVSPRIPVSSCPFDTDCPNTARLSQEGRVVDDSTEQTDGACRHGIGTRAHRGGAEEDRHGFSRGSEADVTYLDFRHGRLVEPRPDGDPEVKFIAPFVGLGFDGEFRSNGALARVESSSSAVSVMEPAMILIGVVMMAPRV